MRSDTLMSDGRCASAAALFPTNWIPLLHDASGVSGFAVAFRSGNNGIHGDGNVAPLPSASQPVKSPKAVFHFIVRVTQLMRISALAKYCMGSYLYYYYYYYYFIGMGVKLGL
jgi:hypothetical protein